MAIITRDDAKGILNLYHPRITSVIQNAWEECRKVAAFRAQEGIGPLLYRRTLSNDMFDAIARYALKEFAADPLVRLKVETQTIKLFFKGMILARFKRGSGSKLGRNVTTQAVMDFIRPNGQLPGMPPEAAKLEFVWMSNDIQTQLEHVFVVARDGNRVVWDYEIEDAAGKSGEVVPLLPHDPTRVDEGDEIIVRPRKTDVVTRNEK